MSDYVVSQYKDNKLQKSVGWSVYELMAGTYSSWETDALIEAIKSAVIDGCDKVTIERIE